MNANGIDGSSRREQPASVFKLAILAFIAVAVVGGLVSLGVWQLHRLAWKRDLIHRVDTRLSENPVAAPGPIQWQSINAANDEYRRVHLRGKYLHDRETLVQTITVRGAGFWVMTPLRTDDGYIVLVNRGFVGPQYKMAATRRAGQVEGSTTVTGLLRLSETNQAFPRRNKPDADRWYSRDLGAIAASRGLTNVAPYFIDAAASASPSPGTPEGGLTVVSFRNDHLEYALTWFALALLVAGGAFLVFHHEWRLRNQTTS